MPELVFYDDCLGLSGKHSADIFMAIAKFQKKARLIGVSHIQLLNPLWLNAFKEAGGAGLMLGIESGALKLRRKMNKHIDDKEICSGVEQLSGAWASSSAFTPWSATPARRSPWSISPGACSKKYRPNR